MTPSEQTSYSFFKNIKTCQHCCKHNFSVPCHHNTATVKATYSTVRLSGHKDVYPALYFLFFITLINVLPQRDQGAV